MNLLRLTKDNPVSLIFLWKNRNADLGKSDWWTQMHWLSEINDKDDNAGLSKMNLCTGAN